MMIQSISALELDVAAPKSQSCESYFSLVVIAEPQSQLKLNPATVDFTEIAIESAIQVRNNKFRLTSDWRLFPSGIKQLRLIV